MPKYVNGEYDIEKAFRAIEDELIHSMIRNFKRTVQRKQKRDITGPHGR